MLDLSDSAKGSGLLIETEHLRFNLTGGTLLCRRLSFSIIVHPTVLSQHYVGCGRGMMLVGLIHPVLAVLKSKKYAAV